MTAIINVKNPCAIIIIVNVILSLIYLQLNNYIPFALDNNETFATIIQARNIFEYGISSSFGITDESFGVRPESHPYVYTHQGNLPRIFSFALMLTGAKSPESQIIVTALIISSFSLYLAYSFFVNRISVRFAVIFCIILITDYFMFFQWQFNTWRVWHFFFLFASLNLAANTFLLSQKSQFILILLNSATLIYYELAYAIFITVIYFMYVVLSSANINTKVWKIALHFGGLAIGASILLAQLVLYYGWDGLIKDIYFTFFARNFAPIGLAELFQFRREAWDFFESNKIVFWDNFISQSLNLRSFSATSLLYAKFNLFVYSPYLVYVFLLINIKLIINYLSSLIKMGNIQLDQLRTQYFLSLLLLTFVVVINHDTRFLGFSAHTISSIVQSKKSILLYLMTIVSLLVWANFTVSNTRVSLSRAIAATTYICMVSIFTHYYSLIYSVDYNVPIFKFEIFWKSVFVSEYNYAIFSKYVVFVVVLLGLDSILKSPDSRSKKLSNDAHQVIVYVLSGIVGLCVVWALMPGYILTAYFQRYVPLLVFFTIILFVYPCNVYAGKLFTVVSKSNAKAYIVCVRSDRSLGLKFFFGLLIMAFSVYWANLQYTYSSKFETGKYELFKQLSIPPFKGSSFVSNSYSAGVSTQTNQWSYFDPLFGGGDIVLTNSGYKYTSEKKYLWFADRHNNVGYSYPDYFLCFANQSVEVLFENTARCGNNIGILNKIHTNYFVDNGIDISHKVASQDIHSSASWAIVKLDNDFPPYLTPFENSTRMIDISVLNGNQLKVNYNFQQQNGHPELDTNIKLLTLSSCGASVADSTSSHNYSDVSSVYFASDPGTVFQFSVQPKTSLKKGLNYLSQPFYRTAYSNIVYCADDNNLVLPSKLILSFSTNGRAIDLTWEDVNQNVRYFDIATTSAGDDFRFLSSVDWRQRSFSVPDAVVPDSQFLIRACNDWACSGWRISDLVAH
jgi:hypothetical protein